MSGLPATVAGILVHTPIWVWPLYALLIFMGFQRTRDNTAPLWRMLILPVVATLFAVSTLISAGLGSLPAMLVGFAIGSAAGWQLGRVGATRRLPDGQVWLRGEWWSFIQLVLLLTFRYVTSVADALDPAFNSNPTWHWGTLGVATALSAMFLGRAAARLRVYFAAATASA